MMMPMPPSVVKVTPFTNSPLLEPSTTITARLACGATSMSFGA